MLFNAVALWPEVAYPLPNVNDDAEHALFVQRSVEAFHDGENPVDMWVPQLELGFPQFALYQHGAHVTVATLDVILPGNIDPRRLFDLIRWLLMVTFPLTVFWSLRHVGIDAVGAAVAGAFAAMLSGAFRYGFEYDSYVWRGLGLYTQLFGMHIAFVAFALLYDVLTRGRRIFAAAIACAALVLTHLIYAYMLALTVPPLFLGTLARGRVRANVLRLGAAGGLALLLSSYVWLPFLRESAYLNVSPYLERSKYDSFGAPTILGWLVSGDLLDHGRLPVVTALVAVGIVAALWTRTRLGLVTVTLLAVWLVLYSGRPLLGPIADLLPLGKSLLYHRFIGGVDLFAIVLVGIGAGALWRLARTETAGWRFAAAALVIALLFAPAFVERSGFYGYNTTWLLQTQAAIARDGDAAAVLAELRRQPPGRAYAGLRSNWGQSLGFGLPFNSVHLYNMLAFDGRDAVAPPYRDASLNSDLLWDFNDQNLAQYALFNVDYVIAPPTVRLPTQLAPLLTTPTLTLYAAPGGGYVEYAGVSARQRFASEDELFPRMRGWLNSDAPARRDFMRLDYPARGPAPADGWAPTSRCPNDGTVAFQNVHPARIETLVECRAASTLVFKVTYNPNWIVTVDEKPVPSYMVTPSYVAVDLPAGRHFVIAEYRSAPIKAPLLALGGLTLLAMAGATLWPRRRSLASALPAAFAWWRTRAPSIRRDLAARTAAHPVATGRALAVAVTLVMLLALRLVTPPIAFNDGLGNDGRLYAAMIRGLREHIDPGLVPPWSYRWGPSLLVALTGLDARTGFELLNAACALLSGLLLYELLRHYGARAPLALLAVAWWAMLPAGVRFGLYYPVLTDSAGFLVLMALLWCAVKERYVLFALALVVGVITRENLLAVGPFLWLANVRRAPVKVTLVSLACGIPAVAAYFLVRAHPLFPPPPEFGNWLERYQVDLNVRWVLENINGHAWRFVLTVPLTLGALFILPLVRAGTSLAFLRRHPAWIYFLVSSVVLVFIGGRDDDRYFYVLAPALAVLTFASVPGERWTGPAMIALTAVHAIGTRFAWPLGRNEADYFEYQVAYMAQSHMWRYTVLVAGCFALVLVLARVRRPGPWSAPPSAA